MKARSIIFWSHLVTGVVTGVIVLSLSISGVLLTYERQITGLTEKSLFIPPTSSTVLSVDEQMNHAKFAAEGSSSISLLFKSDPSYATTITSGRRSIGLMNPYDGDLIQEGQSRTHAVFHWITEFHRWFAAEGESRGLGKAITGAANLGFLFLLVSGAWLWLPKVYKWVMFRTRLVLRKQPNSKARDFHWHHVFAAWAFIPLLFVILTAVVFSYEWGNNLVFSVYGETAPVRGPRTAGQGGAGGNQSADNQANKNKSTDDTASLQSLFEKAKNQSPNWNSIKVTTPKSPTADVSIQVDTGTGGQPTKQSTLVFSRTTGEIVKEETFSDKSPATQTRFYIRFLHTGEALGIIGQTAAGIASLLACLLVYTGLALAYRRLIAPLFKRSTTSVV